MITKVSISDLLLASDWCTSYDDGVRDDDPTELAIKRVGAWLNEQAVAREREAAIRDVMKSHGVARAVAVKAIDRAISEGS